MKEVHMPRLGMTMKEGKLVRWIRKEGDVVQKGDALAEIASEKIVNEIEAPASGVLEKRITAEGDVVPVGTVVALLAEVEQPPVLETPAVEAPPAQEQVRRDVHMPRLGMTMKEGKLVKWVRKQGDTVAKGDALAEIASEKIVNEIEAPASGILERIITPEGDVVPVGAVVAVLLETAGQPAPAPVPPQPVPAAAEDLRIVAEVKPLSAMRRITAERMSESLLRSPQGTMTARADMSGLVALKADYAARGIKVTYTDMLVKLVGLALERVPVINSAIEDGKLITYQSVNIGVGVGTEEGLYVPVIRDVEEKNLLQISQELKDLTRKVKEKTIEPADMAGGTFTISNLGMFDVDIITPIINPPQAAILAIGATRNEVVVLEDNSTAVRPLTTLCFTADHAVMDGIPAVTFLSAMKTMMKQPQDYLG